MIFLNTLYRIISHLVSLKLTMPYPSYCEVALAWVAAAVLSQDDEQSACSALAMVLGGMFKPAPGFWGDTVSATIDGMERENGQGPNGDYLLYRLEEVDASNDRGVDPTVERKPEPVIAWRVKVGLPPDPWSFGLRRRSAVAAVLYRNGDIRKAESLLQEACAEGQGGSYAGFRALARLSLACRWLEWRRILEALAQVEAARADATNVRDDVLRQERVDLVDKMGDWIEQYGHDAAVLAKEEAFAQVQQKMGMERGLYIEFLSALWHDKATPLKRLLPLALDDATTTDAVLGRLLGVEAQQRHPGKPFLALQRSSVE